MKPTRLALRVLPLAFLLVAALPAQEPTGYTDTPRLPDSKWRVHDGERPQPRVVTPGAEVGKAPSDAVVLFDGKDLSAWVAAGGGGGKAGWKVEDGAMVVNGTGSIETREQFGDCQLHLEWAAPSPPEGDSQGRGNSGLFFMGRYEVQILDSFDNKTYPDGQAAAIYGQTPPLVNACRKPGEWQTYDVVFEAPRFERDQLVRPARVTVFHNGVLVHHAREILGGTAHRALATYAPHPPEGPIQLQDHGNPVRYRNVWVRRLKGYDEQ